MKRRQRDIAAGQEADFYCRCDQPFAYGESCPTCGCDYADSATPVERDCEAGA